MIQYHVIGKKDGKELICQRDVPTLRLAAAIRTKWLSEGRNMILTDHRENVRFDEVQIMPVELIWRR